MFQSGEADEVQSWKILRSGSAEAGGRHRAAQLRLRTATDTRREIVSMAVVSDTKTEHKADGAAERQDHERECREVMRCASVYVVGFTYLASWRRP
jgi:hypothetical protein